MNPKHSLLQPVRLLFLALLVGLAGCASDPGQKQVKSVYHINDGLDQASNGLRNIRNHLEADPGAKITVVSHSKGIDFMLEGARDKNGNAFDAIVDDLAAKGVEFKVCNNTLVSRKIDKSKVIMAGVIVPSGVAEIGRLQNREGFSYLKP